MWNDNFLYPRSRNIFIQVSILSSNFIKIITIYNQVSLIFWHTAQLKKNTVKHKAVKLLFKPDSGSDNSFKNCNNDDLILNCISVMSFIQIEYIYCCLIGFNDIKQGTKLTTLMQFKMRSLLMRFLQPLSDAENSLAV